jgi:hypothetical protein
VTTFRIGILLVSVQFEILADKFHFQGQFFIFKLLQLKYSSFDFPKLVFTSTHASSSQFTRTTAAAVSSATCPLSCFNPTHHSKAQNALVFGH